MWIMAPFVYIVSSIGERADLLAVLFCCHFVYWQYRRALPVSGAVKLHSKFPNSNFGRPSGSVSSDGTAVKTQLEE